MRQIFDQLMGKKPTMLTPSQMAMQDMMSGVMEAKRSYDVPAHGADATPSMSSEGSMPSLPIGGDGGGGGGAMALGALSGASGALSGIMKDAQNQPVPPSPAFTQGNPLRDGVIARATSGQAMRGLRYGGYVAPGEEVLVGEDAPEKIVARPDGGVDVVPLEDDRNLLFDKSMEGRVARPGRPSIKPSRPDPFTSQERGVINSAPLGGEYVPDPNGSGRTMSEDTGGIPMDAPEAMADEGNPPPRQSPLETRRIIARNDAGLSDDGVWKAREDVLREDQWKALNEPVKKSKWKDIGMMLLTSMNNQVNNRQDPVRTWGEIKRDEKVGALSPQLQVLQQRRAENDRRRTVDANIANTQEDNKRLADIAENNRTARAEALTQKKREAFYRTNKFFDPTKATDAQKRQLAEIGETPEAVGQYDFTKPDTKTVAGVLYQRNPSTGAYEDTGVKDPSKQVVEYTIIDPDTGVAQKYATTSERAASLKTQLKAAGMQIQAASERQTSQQTYQAGENQKNRTVEMEKFQKTYDDKIKQDILNKTFDATKEMAKLKEALDAQEIDQESFNLLMNMIQANMNAQRSRIK